MTELHSLLALALVLSRRATVLSRTPALTLLSLRTFTFHITLWLLYEDSVREFELTGLLVKAYEFHCFRV